MGDPSGAGNVSRFEPHVLVLCVRLERETKVLAVNPPSIRALPHNKN